ncbi:TIGR03809 family protein [Rhodopseudomonas palustris]|uniref:TIGR03809 family protein n=1 Tax=Rhodopseudomonas palustris TaxID=1076 RepID=A0A323UJI5_RHOPL|nr:TIGR03809 family protein [Rhodopseudomonas palustris]PZA13262.1 TIGR03809 family protein [Rhodopseudomonas palustris]
MEQTDAERGRVLVERWCVLAEQRLEYLTELFESGRWRRFFGEREFLTNVQEAKAAVETWRDLLRREATLDNQPVDLSWLGRNKQVAPRVTFYFDGDLVNGSSSQPRPSAARTVRSAEPAKPAKPVEPAVRPQPIPEPAPAIAPDEVPAWLHALDPERLQQRYSLLRTVG